LIQMSGGAINLTTSTSVLHLNAVSGTDIVATSNFFTGSAEINGPGTLDLGDIDQSITADNGPAATDLFVNAIIAGDDSDLEKLGAGRLELAARNTYTGVTLIQQGDVQVDTLNRQRISLTGFSSGDEFTLTYSNGVVSSTGTTTNITFSGNPVNDAASIQSALIALLNLLNVTGGVVVTQIGALFEVLFNGNTAVNVQPLTGAPVAPATGSVNSAGVQTIGNVVLSGSGPNSASLSGTGWVGNVSMDTGGATGTVNPGANGAGHKTSLLHANGTVNWNTNSTFFADLGNLSGLHPTPIVGSDYDQLFVNGNITLGNALLTGDVVDGGVVINDTFTILRTTGAVTGRFDGIINGVRAQINPGGSVFLNGQKFTVSYLSDRVILNRNLSNLTSLTFSSSANPSVYGQEVGITVTAIAEAGATFATANGQITFTLDNIFTQVVTMSSFGAQTTATATFFPQQFSGDVWAPGSQHTITATFADNANVFSGQQAIASPLSPSPATQFQLVQNVVKNTITLTPGSTPPVTPTSPVYGQTVILSAAINPVVLPNVNGANNPTGNVRFTVDPSSGSPTIFDSPINYLPPGDPLLPEKAFATIFGTQLLTPGSHIVHMRYLGDANYIATAVATPVVFNLFIQPDGSVVTFTPAPTPSPLGQNAVFNITVTPAHAGSIGQPVGTLNFFDGTQPTPLNPAPINYTGGTAVFSLTTLSPGPHNIRAVFTPTNNRYTGSEATFAHVVNQATTQTQITSFTPTTPTFGQQITFNIRVTPSPIISAIYGLPTGSVSLYNGAAIPANLIGGPAAISPSTGMVTILTAVGGLPVGTHTINAVYTPPVTPTSNYATSTGTIVNFVVAQANTTTTLTASPVGSATWGNPVTLTAQVTSGAGLPPAGTHVSFWDGPVGTGTLLGTDDVDAAGRATLVVSNLNAGPHVINARFIDDDDGNVNYAMSTGTLTNYRINFAPTSTVLTTSLPSGTGVFGQPNTLQAAVTSPGGTVNVGTVTFRDGAVVLGTGTVNTSGIATFIATTLSATSHTLSATYVDTVDSSFLTSSNTVTNYTVLPASTVILAANFTNVPPISMLGAPVLLTARVTTVSPSVANVTTGSISFWDGAVGTTFIGTANVNATGVATFTTSTLSLGIHTITAKYNASVPNFLASNEPTVTQDVRRGSTITFNPILAPNNVFSMPLSYAVSIVPVGAATPLPTGDLNIFEIISGAPTLVGSFTGYPGGTVSIPISTLGVGSHTLRLDYTGDAIFAPNSKTITQVVTTAPTTTTLNNTTPSFFGEPVTFIATVTTTATTPPTAGTVTFRDTYLGVTTVLGTITLAGTNVAQLTITAPPLSVGSHVITATYTNTGNPNYASSPTSASKTQIVNAAATQAVLDTTTDSFYGNAVTFRATVSITSGTPGPLPGGTVTFRRTFAAVTTILATVPVNTTTGEAVFTTTPTLLAPGNHIITAKYNGFSPNFGASPLSAPETQVVNKATTAVTITPSIPSGTLTFGKSVTFTALVSITSGGVPGKPIGTVRFWDNAVGAGGTLLKVVTLVTVNTTTAKAVFTTFATQLSATSHNIFAEYLGSSTHAPVTDSITYDVNQATTKTTLTSAPAFWPTNMVTTFTAAVTTTSGGAPGIPTGQVIFYIDSVAQAPVNMVGGKAFFQTTFTASVPTTVSAEYVPTSSPVQNFAASVAIDQTQTPRKPTAMTMTSVSSTSGVVIKVQVTTSQPGGPPTGTVQFFEGNVLLATVAVNSSGYAVTPTLNLATGKHTITAVYSGDANFNPATITKVISGKLIGRLV